MAWTKLRNALCRLPGLLFRGTFANTFDGMPLVARRLPWRKRVNLITCGLDRMLHTRRLLGLTPSIQIEPTNVCNLNCPLCPTGDQTSNRKKGFMSLDTFEKILEELGDVLVQAVLYGWGEPFLHKDLAKMIRACTQRGILTVTSTNGHCLQTFDEALKVVNAGLKALVIAVDGSTQEIYESYRKSGSLEKVKRCVRLVEEAKAQVGSPHPYTTLRAVLTSDNEHDLENLEEMARSLNVNAFSYKVVGSLTGGAGIAEYESAREAWRRQEYEESRRGPRAPVLCPFPFRQPMVFWDGTVVGCEFDYDLETPLGRIGEQTFRQMWNGPRVRTLRRSIYRRAGHPGFCDLCPYRKAGRESTVLVCRQLRPAAPSP